MVEVMFSHRLNQAIISKNSRLCVGLDPRLNLLPQQFLHKKHLAKNNFKAAAQAITEFNQQVIDTIKAYAVAVKLQSAFYEQYRSAGVESFWQTASYARAQGLLVIADVKRGDIGSTAQAYANAYLAAESDFDAITINPFLGEDSLLPFIDTALAGQKGLFILVKTSNPGSRDLQDLKIGQQTLSQKVALLLQKHQNPVDNHGYSSIGAVLGATFPEQAVKLRQLLPRAIFLVPGIGAQGGDIELLSHFFQEDGLGAIVNSSRGVVFSFDQNETEFQDVVAKQAQKLRDEINQVVLASPKH